MTSRMLLTPVMYIRALSNPSPNPEDLEELAFALNDFELTRQVSIEEVERTNLIQDPMEAVPNIPFGHCNARWVVFKDSLQDNETLWEFESTRSELKGVQAMWGYAVKRDGRVDRFMTTGWKLKIGQFFLLQVSDNCMSLAM